MLKTTSEYLRQLGFTSPGVLINEDQARANIRTMANKARKAGAVFRPHFKTHQSADVGRWFAEEGVKAITVSSVAMAEYFAAHGWDDITVAFLLNPLEWDRIDALARDLDGRGGILAITVDSVAAAASVADHTEIPLAVWIKVDAGYGRTGVSWQDPKLLQDIVNLLHGGGRLKGLLTHSGNSYQANSRADLTMIWNRTVQRLHTMAGKLDGELNLDISLGDTPCCWSLPELPGVQEIRPGNFVFFDMMQYTHGICSDEELAAAAICPVVGLYPKRNQIVVHGGAVHLSKESLMGPDGKEIYGYLGTMTPTSTSPIDLHPKPRQRVIKDVPVTSLSQEHGTIEVSHSIYEKYFNKLAIGDLILVWPVHSCLTCDLAGGYRTTSGYLLNKKPAK